MRFFFLYLIIFVINISILQSQRLPGGIEKQDYEKKETKGSFYGGIVGKAANIFDDWGVEIGARAGIMLTNHFGIGFGFYTLITHNVDIDSPEFEDINAFLRLSYGGIEAEYYILPGKRFNISLLALVGGGIINYSNYSNVDLGLDPAGSWIFLTEPGISFNLEILKKTYIGLSLNYRITGGVDFKKIKNSDLSGPVIGISIKSIIM